MVVKALKDRSNCFRSGVLRGASMSVRLLEASERVDSSGNMAVKSLT